MSRRQRWLIIGVGVLQAFLLTLFLKWSLGVQPAGVRPFLLFSLSLAWSTLFVLAHFIERHQLRPSREAMRRAIKRAEDQTERLAFEQERLTAILEHLSDALLVIDGQGTVKLLNQAAAQLFDVEIATATGASLTAVVRDHRLVQLWRRCLEGKQEEIALLEEGTTGHHLLQAIVKPLERLGADTALLIIQDLTQVRRLETVRRDFISNISHELRTPLSSLKALVETLQDGAIDDPLMAHHFLEKMEEEVDALAQMVDELLELSRIESGKVPLRFRPTSIEEILYPPVERLRMQAERKGLHLSCNIPPGLPAVLADAQRMQRVIGNLLHNAIKFTERGEISLYASLGECEVILSVQDTGIGIPKELLPRIFERFYKADRARSGEGTGLGLAIAKHLVLAHHGRIWAESTEGQGSTFHVALPLAPCNLDKDG